MILHDVTDISQLKLPIAILPSCHLATCGGPHHAPDWNKLLTQNIK